VLVLITALFVRIAASKFQIIYEIRKLSPTAKAVLARRKLRLIYD
jgi:hypothetical protein